MSRSRRRTLGLLAGVWLSGLAGCSTRLESLSTGSSTTPAAAADDSPLTVRRVSLDRFPAVVSTYQTSFSEPEDDWAAQTLGPPESATLLLEVDCTLPEGETQDIARLECVVYDESGIEQGRWARDWETSVKSGLWTFREQFGVELDPGEYIIESRLQRESSTGMETIASDRMEFTVTAVTQPPADIPWENLDNDSGSELHIGVPYAVSVDADDRRVQRADPVIDALATSAAKATYNPGRWYLDEIVDLTVDRPPLASGDNIAVPEVAATADVSVVDHDDGTVTVFWTNRPVDIDGAQRRIRYDRALVIVSVGPEATVTDPGSADYVLSDGQWSETTLVWMPTRVGKRLTPHETVDTPYTLSQHSFRIERVQLPETPTPRETDTPTAIPEESTERETPITTPTPRLLPQSVDVIAQVQLQLGPLRSRTVGPLPYGEPIDTTIGEVDGVYTRDDWRERPQASRWLTAGFAQQTQTVAFAAAAAEAGSNASRADTDSVTPQRVSNSPDGEGTDSAETVPVWRRGDWPTTQFSMTRTANASPTVGVSSTVSGQWRVDTGDRNEAAYRRAINSSPAIVDGVVYIGSNDGSLYAIDAVTGEVVWTFQTGERIVSSPTVVAGTVLVGSDDGTLYALETARGRGSDEGAVEERTETPAVEWRVPMAAPVRTTPAVVGDRAYVGGTDGCLHAFDMRDGRERWAVTLAEGPSDVAVTTPTVTDSGVFAADSRGRIHACTRRGSRRWLRETDGPVRSAPVYFKNTVYAGSEDGRLYALDAASGAVTWTAQTEGPVVTSPAITRELVIVGSTDSRLYAFDRVSGAEVWSVETGDAIFSSPAVGGTTVYVGSRDGRLYAIDAWYGRERWNRRMPGPVVYSSPAVVDGLVAVGSIDGSVNGVFSG